MDIRKTVYKTLNDAQRVKDKTFADAKSAIFDQNQEYLKAISKATSGPEAELKQFLKVDEKTGKVSIDESKREAYTKFIKGKKLDEDNDAIKNMNKIMSDLETVNKAQELSKATEAQEYNKLVFGEGRESQRLADMALKTGNREETAKSMTGTYWSFDQSGASIAQLMAQFNKDGKSTWESGNSHSEYFIPPELKEGGYVYDALARRFWRWIIRKNIR